MHGFALAARVTDFKLVPVSSDSPWAIMEFLSFGVFLGESLGHICLYSGLIPALLLLRNQSWRV